MIGKRNVSVCIGHEFGHALHLAYSISLKAEKDRQKELKVACENRRCDSVDRCKRQNVAPDQKITLNGIPLLQ